MSRNLKNSHFGSLPDNGDMMGVSGTCIGKVRFSQRDGLEAGQYSHTGDHADFSGHYHLDRRTSAAGDVMI